MATCCTTIRTTTGRASRSQQNRPRRAPACVMFGRTNPEQRANVRPKFSRSSPEVLARPVPVPLKTAWQAARAQTQPRAPTRALTRLSKPNTSCFWRQNGPAEPGLASQIFFLKTETKRRGADRRGGPRTCRTLATPVRRRGIVRIVLVALLRDGHRPGRTATRVLVGQGPGQGRGQTCRHRP